MDYAYTALDIYGSKVNGVITAKNINAARSAIASQKLDIIKIKPKRANIFKSFNHGKSKLTAKELISILLNVGELDKIGMPMIHIIEILRNDIATGPKMKDFCRKLYNTVKSGGTLGDAFEKQVGAVDPIYVNFVKIAEDTGNYHNIFSKVIEYIKWTDQMNRKVKAILLKSISSFVFVFVLIVGISTVIIPKTVSFLTDNGIPIPSYTRAMMNLSNFIITKGHIMAICFVLLIITMPIITKIPKVRYKIDSFKLKLPAVGVLIANIETARFVTFFAIMFECGIRVESIFDRVKDIIKNKYVQKRMIKVQHMITNGSLPQEALEIAAPFQKHITKMLGIGFSSGNIKDIMSNTRYFLDRDIEERMDLVISSIKPAILVLTGILVAWMAVSVFGPIYGSLGSFGDNKPQSSAGGKSDTT